MGQTENFSYTYNREITHKHSLHMLSSEVRHYLTGLRFPAPKDQVIKQAKVNHVDAATMNILCQLNELEYKDMTMIIDEIKKLW